MAATTPGWPLLDPLLGGEECQVSMAPSKLTLPGTRTSHGVAYHPESHQGSLQESEDHITWVAPTVQDPAVAGEQSQGKEKEPDGGP